MRGRSWEDALGIGFDPSRRGRWKSFRGETDSGPEIPSYLCCLLAWLPNSPLLPWEVAGVITPLTDSRGEGRCPVQGQSAGEWQGWALPGTNRVPWRLLPVGLSLLVDVRQPHRLELGEAVPLLSAFVLFLDRPTPVGPGASSRSGVGHRTREPPSFPGW